MYHLSLIHCMRNIGQDRPQRILIIRRGFNAPDRDWSTWDCLEKGCGPCIYDWDIFLDFVSGGEKVHLDEKIMGYIPDRFRAQFLRAWFTGKIKREG